MKNVKNLSPFGRATAAILLVSSSSLQAATLGTGNLQELNALISGVTIAPGTDLSNSLVRDAMWDGVGFRINSVGSARISAYDTEGTGGADPDIERSSNNPPGANAGEWVAGNFSTTPGLSAAQQLGLIAIVQNLGQNPGETLDANGVPVFTTPNDNANGGVIVFDLKVSLAMRRFTVTALDVDNAAGDSYSVFITGAGGTTATIDLVANAASQGLTPIYGDRSLNNLGVVSLPNNEIITQVQYTISGDSGGTGGFVFDTVPEPSSTGLLALGGLALLSRRKR